MKMKIDEAKAECERYLAYLKAQEDKSIALQKLASDRRRGLCDDKEKDRRIAEINGFSPTVYDGGNLANAIRVLLAAL